MKQQATIKQIENTKFIAIFILWTTFKNMEYIQKNPTWDSFWNVLRLDESAPCNDTSSWKKCEKVAKKLFPNISTAASRLYAIA